MAAAPIGGALIVWNVLFMEQYRRNLIPRDDTVSFVNVAENNAQILAQELGSPLSWPANWFFAARLALPAQSFDEILGRRLSEAGQGEAVLRMSDPEAQQGLLADGWGARAMCGSEVCRPILTHARLWLPMERAESFELGVRSAGKGTLALSLDGRRLSEWPLSEEAVERRVQVMSAQWRVPVSVLSFDSEASQPAYVIAVRLRRLEGERR
jgi:hypothetical protein